MVQTEFSTVVEELEEIDRQLDALMNAYESGSRESVLTHIDNIATIMEANDRDSSAAGVRRFEEDYKNDELAGDIDPADVFQSWRVQIDLLLDMAEMVGGLESALGGA